MTRRVAHAAQVGALALALVLVPAAIAAKGNGGAGGKPSGGGTCTRKTPGISVDNNYAWSQWGSWGKPGQRLTYLIQVANYDQGCNSSSFVVSLSAPDGFSVSVPTSTVSLRSASSASLWAYVTSPSAIPDGDYPLTVTVTRAGTSSDTSSFTSSYKVYSSDTAAPTMFWPNPAPGQTISGSTFNVVVSSSDDHAVRKVDFYMDGTHMASTDCENITYTCQLSYKWRVGARGPHTARFEATDWMGNVGVETVNFTVG